MDKRLLTYNRLLFQAKFFELFEYVVFHLNHVPCKELLALTILLKTQR